MLDETILGLFLRLLVYFSVLFAWGYSAYFLLARKNLFPTQRKLLWVVLFVTSLLICAEVALRLANRLGCCKALDGIYF